MTTTTSRSPFPVRSRLEAAHEVGCPSPAVASHKYSREQPAEAGPTLLLDALTEPIAGL